MTNQQLAVRAISEAQPILEEYLRPRPQNNERILDTVGGSSRTPRFGSRSKPLAATKLCFRAQMRKLPSFALVAWIATLLSVGTANAQAKQQCTAATPSNPHGRWWSYRLIDGRKCWYEGKPMLSKSLLEWPKEPSARPVSNGEVTSVVTEKPGNPLDSQARALKDSDTFDARWRERVKMQ
jgi:hypothetical protein